MQLLHNLILLGLFSFLLFPFLIVLSVHPGGSKKKSKRAKKSAPTLTEKTVKGAGAKKRAKKAATGVGKAT